MTQQLESPPCPRCGSNQAALVHSREIFPVLARRTAPVAVACRYECGCGSVYVVSVRSAVDAQTEAPPA